MRKSTVGLSFGYSVGGRVELQIMTADDPEGLDTLRHSTAT